MRDHKHFFEMRNDKVKVKFGGGGIKGFCSGPEHTLIHKLALSDPLIARLPSPPGLEKGFIPGHIFRKIPRGLLESYQQGKNLIEDPELREYYDKLLFVTRGNLFTLKRFKYIWELNVYSGRKYRKCYF